MLFHQGKIMIKSIVECAHQTAHPETNQSLAPALMNPKIHGLHLINRIITIINRNLYAAYDCLYQKMISQMIDGLMGVGARITDKDGKYIRVHAGLDHSNFLITSSCALTVYRISFARKLCCTQSRTAIRKQLFDSFINTFQFSSIIQLRLNDVMQILIVVQFKQR